MAKNKVLVDYFIENWWFILGFLFLIIYKGKLGLASMDKALLGFSVWCLFFIFVRLGFSSLKNATPKIVANPIHTTTTGKWTSIGNYIVFRMGGIRSAGFEWELNEGTIVVPRASVNIVGDNITLLSRLEEVELPELPPGVRRLVTPMNWKPPYIFGLADEIQELRKPEVSFLQDEIKNLNTALDKADKIIQRTTKLVEDFISSESRISLVGKRASIFDRLKQSLTKEKEDGF